jgi:hypothetical protein
MATVQQKNYLTWFAYAAALWSFVFAFISLYWAAGGTVGVATLGDDINSLKNDSWFITLVWLTGFLKILAGFIALSFTRLPKMRNMQKLLTIAAWGIGVMLTLYGGANLAVRAAMRIGWIPTPQTMHSTAAYWHLVLWDPLWLLGGVLFLGCAILLSVKPGRI